MNAEVHSANSGKIYCRTFSFILCVEGALHLSVGLLQIRVWGCSCATGFPEPALSGMTLHTFCYTKQPYQEMSHMKGNTSTAKKQPTETAVTTFPKNLYTVFGCRNLRFLLDFFMATGLTPNSFGKLTDNPRSTVQALRDQLKKDDMKVSAPAQWRRGSGRTTWRSPIYSGSKESILWISYSSSRRKRDKGCGSAVASRPHSTGPVAAFQQMPFRNFHICQTASRNPD